MRAVEVGSNAALAIATTSVYLFLLCRGILALGEAGNFPAAIKVTAEYFPKKDRAFATSIFNAGASVGALAAPLCIPPLAMKFGWELAFIIIGALGFIWMFFWAFMYDKPEKSKHVNEAELEYIHQDDAEKAEAASKEDTGEKQISLWKCFSFKQTWQFVIGKFFTDGVWWFFLFWAPSYFSNQFNAPVTTPLGQWLIFTLYLIVTVVSIGGGYLPKIFVEKKGMHPYPGRMLAMLIFAFFPLCALLAQPLGMRFNSAWIPAILIGLAAAAWRRTPGMVGQPLQHHRRHVPQERHCNRNRNRRHGRRRGVDVHPEDSRQALYIFGADGRRVYLPGLQRQTCRIFHCILLLRRGLPDRVGNYDEPCTQV